MTRTFTAATPDAAHCAFCGEHFAFHYAGFACDRPAPAERIIAALDAALACVPAITDEVLAAQNAALRQALIACRALHTGAEFMKGEAQKVLWHVDAVLEETRR